MCLYYYTIEVIEKVTGIGALIEEYMHHVDVFDKFRDDTGSFDINLSNDTRGLLSLYNAAHMAVPGEMVLDDAITFTRRHLEAAKGKLRSPIEEQVSRSLEIPLPRFMW